MLYAELKHTFNHDSRYKVIYESNKETFWIGGKTVVRVVFVQKVRCVPHILKQMNVIIIMNLKI